jgi:ABC-type polysaccharide/polyol phosphate export permease
MARLTSTPIYDSSEDSIAALRELQDAFQYRNLIFQMIRRDILTRYKRSVLGVAWTMLNPLGTMLIMTIVFSHIFTGTEGYPALVLSGILAWNFFSQTTNAAVLHLVWGGTLLKKVYIPRTVFAISATGTGLVNLVLAIVPLLVVMLVTGMPIRWVMLFLPVPILLLAAFALGLGLLISTIAVYFADVVEMYQVVLMAWFYVSPVIYPETILPEAYRIWIARLNPMYHLIGLFRAPIYEGRIPDLNEILLSAAIAIGMLLVGWVVFSKKADEFAYRI